jgi:hypothetical protein
MLPLEEEDVAVALEPASVEPPGGGMAGPSAADDPEPVDDTAACASAEGS